MRHYLLLLLLLLSFNTLANTSDFDKTAENWLKLIDSEQYKASWQGTSDRFKNQVSEAQWQTALQQVRSPLGKIIKRTPINNKHHTSLPGMPDADYRVMQFNTEYEHKKDTVETLSMVKIEDVWYTIGYFIR